jgi:hypothetical protein
LASGCLIAVADPVNLASSLEGINIGSRTSPESVAGCEAQRGRCSHGVESAPLPPIQSQPPARSFYLPCNKLSQPSISTIPGHAISVTEVYKWQQQPKLKRPQPQPIPSNAG